MIAVEFAGVADTHTALWYLFDDPRLSDPAASFIERAAAANLKIAVSSISLAEIVYLVEKGRLPNAAYTDLLRTLSNPRHVFGEVVFTAAITRSMHLIPRSEVPDMPDRLIAATAIHLGVPIVTVDGRIRRTSLQSIW